MLALSEELLTIIRRHAAPLSPAARQRFYERIDLELGDQYVLGPGLVARVCRKVRRQFIVMPDHGPTVDER